MAIQWSGFAATTPMSHQVLDNDGQPPTTVLTAGVPFKVNVSWSVPPLLATLIGSSDKFRLRVYAESLGPGQEVQIGGTTVVDGVAMRQNYAHQIDIDPNPLLGEGQVFDGATVSGLYKVFCVLQHLNDNVPTVHSGKSDSEPTVMFKAP